MNVSLDIYSLRDNSIWNTIYLRAGTHYMTFANFCSLDKSTVVAECLLTDLTENRVVYDGHRLQCFSFRLNMF